MFDLFLFPACRLVLERLVVRKAGETLKQSELDDILRYGAKELFAEEEDTAAGTSSTEGDAGTAGGTTRGTAAAGGTASRRIVYDDAAVERLLDRSQLNAPGEHEDFVLVDILTSIRGEHNGFCVYIATNRGEHVCENAVSSTSIKRF